ncbi:MAG: ArnT family glycosyltransferase [Tepidimonas sp.]|uniref:ArnT family glycosyltransferase n=1 Tax=Tepidimonas sp. TaxID=2002775 RepID=UPI0040551810
MNAEPVAPRERIAVIALPLLVLLWRLGAAPLFDVDEGAFAEATREMLARGDYLSTWLAEQPRFDKPILIYWLQALAVALAGPNEWAFRLPSAVAASAWAWAVWAFARPRFGREAALLALLITCTAIGPWIIGRAATADALLNLWLCLTLFDLQRHLEHGARAPLWRAYLWIGLGVLTKGPIAVLIPLAVCTLEALARRDGLAWRRAVFDPVGWAIAAAVCVPWYAAMLAVHGQAFIDGFFLKHNVQRFATPLEGHSGSLIYYAVALPLLLLPWSAVLPAALARARRDWLDPLARVLWLWCGFVLVFFSLSGTKLPHYALYGATPLFVLLARQAASLQHARWTLALPTAVIAALPFLPEAAAWLAGHTADAFYRAQLAQAPHRADSAYRWITIGALLLWLAIAWKTAWPVARRLAAAALLQALVLASAVVPWAGAVLQGPIKAAGQRTAEAGATAVLWRFDAPSFSVYRGRATPKREPQPGEWALTRLDRLPPWPHTIVYQSGGVVLLVRAAP